jgi:soluble lytic murein transglycosylase
VRRLVLIALALAVVVGLWLGGQALLDGMRNVATGDWMSPSVRPLRYEDIIRTAARRHRVDPALVAAVIHVESGFDAEARSSQGAVGLMQLLPETAQFIADRTGGREYVPADLTDPAVNIRYGTYYLRLLLDMYHGDVLSAVAAYNAGHGAVSEWRAAAAADGRRFRRDDIPYTETKAYVERVLSLRTQYREAYGEQLATP